MMKLAPTLFAAGLALAALAATAEPAQAKPGFYLSTLGFGLYIGPRYHHRHYYYRHYHYRPYYYRPYYYRPYYYQPYYYRPYRRHYGRCGYWAKRCARNWGWHNRNWRGCMRYYGCR